MVLMLFGSSEYGSHLRSELGHFFGLGHLFTSTSAKFEFTCATYTDIPFNTQTMLKTVWIWIILKRKDIGVTKKGCLPLRGSSS